MAKKELEEVMAVMEEVVTDFAVPRNIKRSVEQAKNLVKKDGANEVEFTSAIYLLDESLNDINMPFHTRTELMAVISKLEKVKEELK
ncbi:UPF0147 family protein [archaeon]|nr:UPF0147 family protein [archaeon]